MEPRIQYAQTKDGVSIAFWSIGEGTPLVVMPDLLFSNVELEYRIPQFRQSYGRLAERRTLIRYDGRGTGLSDRDASNYSMEARILDLEAVTGQLNLQKFALFGGTSQGLAAVAYAVRRPERISHLMLWCSYVKGSDYLGLPEVKALRGLIDADWGTFAETAIRARTAGWSAGEEAHQAAELVRDWTSPDVARAAFDALSGYDVSELLPKVTVPTLVLHRRQLRSPPVDLGRALAAGIRGAHLAVLDGGSLSPWVLDEEPVLAAIDEFLGEGEEPAGAARLAPEDIRTILFTDVEGSTALTQWLGDARARELLREHERIVREALKAHGGAEVKTLGDGFMTSFSSATKALECAIAMQRAFAQRNESAAEPILVRVGLNAGEPIAEDDDLYGTAVNEAARITATAKGGEILVSNVVRELAKGKAFLFTDRGGASLKGFEDRVHIYQVSWREG